MGKNNINFASTKNRDGEPQKFSAVATWKSDVSGDGAGSDLSSSFTLRSMEMADEEPVYGKADEFVLRFLKGKGSAAALSEIEGSADTCSSNAARLAVYRLAKSGTIYRSNPNIKGRGIEAKYDLVSRRDPTIGRIDPDLAEAAAHQLDLESNDGA
jgi:hypothetical protein